MFCILLKKKQFIHKVVIIKHIYLQNSLKQISFWLFFTPHPPSNNKQKTKQQADKQTNKWEKTQNKPHNLLIRSVHCLNKKSLTFGSSGMELFCCPSRCNCLNGKTNCIGFSYCKESLMLQSCKIYNEIRYFRTKQITENLHTCSLKQLCYIPVLTCWCL